MESVKISDIVSIAPSYTSEVNIAFDYSNPEMNALKVQGYIPTAPAVKALRQITQGLVPISDRRVHLVTGMYGTGKSHFGLVLANLFGRRPDDPHVAEFIRHVERVDADAAKLISRNRGGIAERFLVVILKLSSDPGGFNHLLLSGLQEALTQSGIGYTPKTRFGDAVKLLDTYAQDPMFKTRFEQELSKHRTDILRLRGNLSGLKVEAYNLFCLVYEAVIHTPYRPEHFGDPVEVYKDTVKYIRSAADLAGILVIVDEFGTHLSHMARDPSGHEALAVQSFAEFCKRTREDQVHFLAIAHRTLADYAVGLESQEDWRRVSGRFIESEYSLDVAGGNNYEIVELISNVLLPPQNPAERERLWPAIQAGLASTVDWVQETKLYAGQPPSWIEAKLVGGCYPLHAASTFCLPWLAQRVGQANRTAFKFLESHEPGGLQQFIDTTDVIVSEANLILYPPDRLIEYFGHGAIEHAEHRATMAALEAALAVCGSEPLAVRLVNLLAVLEIVRQPALPPKGAILVSLLAPSPGERADVERLLETLEKQHIIRLRPATGFYELVHRGTGEIDAREAILKIKETVRANFSLVDDLSERAILESVPARDYEARHGVPRVAERQLVLPRHLDNLEAFRTEIKNWYSPNATAKQNTDALILYILARDETDIDAARGRLTSGTGSDQLVVAIPKHPFSAGDALLELKAIRELRMNPRLIEGRVDSDDLARVDQDRQTEIEKAIKTYFQADNFNWYYGSNVTTAVPTHGEESLVSAILQSVFDKTPLIRDEALVASKDSKRKDRLTAMQRLLEINAPLQIVKQLGPPSERMLRSALRDTELLEKQADLGKAESFEVRLTAPEQSPLAQVWGDLRNMMTKPDVPVPLSDIVQPLLAPPYGLTRQLTELLLAAALRTVKDQCVIFGGHRNVTRTTRPQDYQQVPLTAEYIPKFVREADDYVLMYYEILPAQRGFVRALMTALDPDYKPGSAGGLLEQGKEVLLSWFGQLPLATRMATDLSSQAQNVARLLREADKVPDAKTLIIERLPEALLGKRLTSAWTNQTNQDLESAFRHIYEELANYIQGRRLKAIEQLCDAFGTTGRTQTDLDTAVRRWYSELPEFRRLHRFAGEAGHLITAINEEGDVVQRFLVRLPETLGLPPYTEWVEVNASDMLALKVQLGKTTIEAWMPTDEPESSAPKALNLSDKIRNQVRTLLEMSGLVRDAQIEILKSLLADLEKHD
jgi:hypothetical protein